MAVAHDRSVIETNIVNVCVVPNIRVFRYVQGVFFFTETQRKLSVLKHRDLFLFDKYSAISLAFWTENRNRTAAVVDFYAMISTYSCCSCAQPQSMNLLFRSQNSRSLN